MTHNTCIICMTRHIRGMVLYLEYNIYSQMQVVAQITVKTTIILVLLTKNGILTSIRSVKTRGKRLGHA